MLRHDPGGGRAAEPLRRQPARHDPAGSRRAAARARAWPICRTWSAPRCSGRQGSWRRTGWRSISRADLPMLELDMVLFEQVLFNLLDNAAKYAPAGSLVRLRAWRDGEQVSPAGASTRATASRRQRPGARLRQILPRPQAPIASAPAPGSASRSAAASSRRWAAASRPRTARDRSGAVFTITLPVPRSAKPACTRRTPA